jgi:uncharacterized protein with PIN domain
MQTVVEYEMRKARTLSELEAERADYWRGYHWMRVASR